MVFRRGPLRRMIRPAAPVNEVLRQALLKANRSQEAGEYLQAAEIFENLARGLENRKRPVRAAALFIQAGQTRLFGGQAEAGGQLARHGLSILAQNQRWRIFHRAGNDLAAEFRDRGQAKLAADLQTWIDQTLPGQLEPQSPAPADQAPPQPPRRLPAKCPFCGASLRADLAEWIDELTAECPYCGSAVQAE